MRKSFCVALALLSVAACSPGIANQTAANPTAANQAVVAPAPGQPTVVTQVAGPPLSGGQTMAPGMIGVNLAAVQQGSDFFKFFHLAPTGPANAPGVVDFRPTGQFAALVDVAVTVDGADRITAITLTLARSFIDDPANGVFARDIAKSFLLGAPPPADSQQVRALASDIFSSGTVRGYTPQTPAYTVFAGASQAPSVADLASTHFMMGPSSPGGVPALTISFVAR
jgi:hypothetical protein